MIYLVSMYDSSYARREMEYTRLFLNSKCNKEVARCITDPLQLNQVKDDDAVVLADWHQHPSYYSDSSFTKWSWDEEISKLNKNNIVAWAGDTRFKNDLPGIKYAISYVPTTFMNFTNDEIHAFFDRFWGTSKHPRLISWKDLLPQLQYDYCLAETQVDWFVPIWNKAKEYDLTYIINGAMKYRHYQFDWLEKIDNNMQLGNWPNSKHEFLREFAAKHPDNEYVAEKMFKPGQFLNAIASGYYTIIANDDNVTMPKLLVARFWEAIRANVIPLIHIENDPDKQIYHNFPTLKKYCYFEDGGQLKYIVKIKPEYSACKRELNELRTRYIGR